MSSSKDHQKFIWSFVQPSVLIFLTLLLCNWQYLYWTSVSKVFFCCWFVWFILNNLLINHIWKEIYFLIIWWSIYNFITTNRVVFIRNFKIWRKNVINKSSKFTGQPAWNSSVLCMFLPYLAPRLCRYIRWDQKPVSCNIDVATFVEIINLQHAISSVLPYSSKS